MHSTDEDQPAPRPFPALKVLERQCPPLFDGRPPYWRAPLTPPTAEFYCPTWNWQSPHDFPEGAEVTVLHTAAALLEAAGACFIAHSQLVRTGPLTSERRPRTVAPGYYRITIPRWAFSGTIVSPLGDSARLETEPTVWVAAPTLVLLLDLEQAGHFAGLSILDSWTAPVRADLCSWTARMKSLRTECLDRIATCHTDAARAAARARYEAFTASCAAAIADMLTGDGHLTRRPDWAHTIYAQHAAMQWRTAWRYTYTGAPLVALPHTDEIAVLAKDLPDILALAKPPFAYDPTGRQAGALTARQTTHISAAPYEDTVALADEMEDVL